MPAIAGKSEQMEGGREGLNGAGVDRVATGVEKRVDWAWGGVDSVAALHTES